MAARNSPAQSDGAKKERYPQLNHEARPRHLGSVEGRLNQFIGGHYAGVNLSALHFADRKDDPSHVSLSVWSAPGRSKPSFAEAKRQTYKATKKGEQFGPSWTNHWFKIALHIPKEWEGYERVQFEFDCSGEAMVFTTDGDPIHGLTGGWGEDRRVEFIIPPSARKAGVAHFYIEASCNGMFGIDNMAPPDQNRYYKLNSADLVVPNMEAWHLMWDFQTLHQTMRELPDDTPLRNRCLHVANEIMNVFQEGSLESVTKCRKVAEEILGEAWEKEIGKESKKAAKERGALWGVGHCHIDTAWLWPFSVTQQKSARSWSTQIDLMDRYPEHRFSATQAQQFKWTEQLYPSLFARIKERVAEGSFQPTGATWVEMDCNMPSGEALVRQFLYGQRYYHSRFGFKCKTFVLPDTFGYSSQLPQIARLAGCDNFFTQKLSWNNDNDFPNSTFNWVGLDSSQILTHMTPVNNYNSQCNMEDIRRGMTGNKNMEVTSQALLLYGNGDGGGGPTPPMLEKLRRARAIGKHPSAGGQIPLVHMGGSMDEFYAAIRDETKDARLLPNWRGELYAEFHRGTYTTHASIKKGNRKGEILLREAEHAATMASIASAPYHYPQKKLDAAWEDLLLCQFHDVLPGSGIGMIYEDAEERYANVQKIGAEVLKSAYDVLYPGSKAIEEGISGMDLFAINTLPGVPRLEVMEVAGKAGVVAQRGASGKGYVLVQAQDGLGNVKALDGSVQGVKVQQIGESLIMSNGTLKMEMKEGRIVSVYDAQADKEIIPEGQSGGLVIMEDHPNAWDAWDVDQFHLEKQTHLSFGSASIVESGPLRGVIGTSLRIGQSSIEVQIIMDAVPASLKADARSMIRFDAVVDWREKHKFLKFELPMTISAENATYDTQFGVVSRPTHRNTSWDNAKFEVCGHKFADLSEYGYGVAILNDCKYGYATEGNVMRLSLLRAPTEPDANCDMGTHAFSFAIYPHKGTFAESDVPIVAAAFNMPMQCNISDADRQDIASVAKRPPITLEGAPNVILETIKRGEDDEADGTFCIVLRMFEQYGGHARPTLKLRDLAIKKIQLVNLLEEPVHEIEVKSTTFAGETVHDVQLCFRGFEIKTVRVCLERRRKEKERRGSSGSWVKV
ncbi:alpha-mannosidase [Dioszegia hungarica]|uniref:Alpha-mannosidase n=1 Tax=Dioszegia hungarica TaxID=4972 RepID=A0AA38LRZ4_9TREE|nr:alpha-mannosidase [Dioszegia hungarica]KAI9633630.1 alpha-mannosidase [Dioszegia hungarica]